MTDLEKSKLRQKVSKLFVEYGRVKGFLESRGTKIETPESVFLINSTKENDSFIFEIDGLNQVWNMTELLRDKIEETINIETADFDPCNSIIESWCAETYDNLDKIERSIKVKTQN